MEKNKKNGDHFHNWKKNLWEFFLSFGENLLDPLKTIAKKKMEEIVGKIKRSFLGGFLILLGLVYFLFGLGKFLDYILGYETGWGYIAVGGISAIIGLFIVRK